MPLPWEEYQTKQPQERKPWEDYGAAPQIPARLTQKAKSVDPEITRMADAYEKIRGNGAFAAATDAGVGGIPFADEMYSVVSALPNAAVSAIRGNGFHPVDEYNKSQALQAELDRRRNQQHPVASTVGSVLSGVGATAPISAGGASFLNGAKPTILSMLGRGAAEGAAYGTAYGAGEGSGLEQRAQNALTGGLGGGLTGGALGLLSGALASRANQAASSAAAPTLDDLRQAGQAAYQQADKAGVIFTPDAVNRLKMDVGRKLVDIGYDPALQPGAAAVVKRITDMEGQNVTLTGLDSLRKVAQNGYIPGNKSNNKAIGDIVNAIDDLVTSPQANEVLTGNAQAAADSLATAREMWSRMSKSQRVSDAVSRAELRAASTGSGGNADNAIRQNLRKILENPRGFSETEKAALEKAVTGTTGQNALRLAGKLSPSGNGLMAALGIGGAMYNPLLGAASLGGMGAKAVADGMTRGNVGLLDTLIRSGGNMPQQQVPPLLQALTELLTHGAGQQLPAYTSQH